MDDDPADSITLDHPERTSVGVNVGTFEYTLGQPREKPDFADVTVEAADSDHVHLSIDATAGDHGTGHADVELTRSEARALRDLLDETLRWMSDD